MVSMIVARLDDLNKIFLDQMFPKCRLTDSSQFIRIGFCYFTGPLSMNAIDISRRLFRNCIVVGYLRSRAADIMSNATDYRPPGVQNIDCS